MIYMEACNEIRMMILSELLLISRGVMDNLLIVLCNISQSLLNFLPELCNIGN